MDSVEIAAAAELKQLGDIPIDDVIGILDREPSGYRDLYYRWEQQQWEAGAIDFSEDRQQWDALSADLKRSLTWAVASLGAGPEQLTDALVPLVDAAPSEEHHLFLTTQLVDEARHMVFFDLFDERVLDQARVGMAERLGHRRDLLSGAARSVWFDLLPAAGTKVRTDTDTIAAVVEGVVLSHIAAAATLQLTGARFLLDFLRADDLLPGFRHGATAIVRDATRHIAFGVMFLKESIEVDRRLEGVVRSKLDDLAPLVLDGLEPPDADLGYLAPLPYTAADLKAYAQASLAARKKAIGLAG